MLIRLKPAQKTILFSEVFNSVSMFYFFRQFHLACFLQFLPDIFVSFLPFEFKLFSRKNFAPTILLNMLCQDLDDEIASIVLSGWARLMLQSLSFVAMFFLFSAFCVNCLDILCKCLMTDEMTIGDVVDRFRSKNGNGNVIQVCYVW